MPKFARFLPVLTAVLLTVPTAARAECTRTSSALSEARAARWLIGDDLRIQASLDAERLRLREAQQLGGARQPFHLFAAAAAGYQRVFGLETCSNLGLRDGGLDRFRGAGSVGFTHEATGLHARVSFVHADDHLAVGGLGPPKKAEEATAGYRQELVAVRFGHELWFQGMLGYVSNEAPYTSPGTGIQLNPRLPASPSPGYFVGASMPILHTSVVTLLQRGKTELVTVLANDLRLPKLPFSVALGPSYIREERQVVGLLRLRGYASEFYEAPHRTTERQGKRNVEGVSESYDNTGPTLEASMETREARLRHARFRYQFGRAYRFGAAGWGGRAAYDLGVYAEGTVFRSRFYSESRDVVGTGVQGLVLSDKRGTAWGGGAGGNASFQVSWLAFSVDANASVNRPELLSVLPSASYRAELQVFGSLRVEY